MNEGHEGRSHGQGGHGQGGHGLKPEAEKCPVSRRHKNNAPVLIFRRLDGGYLSASGFNPWLFFLFVLLGVIGCAPVHAALASQPMTVKDYFLRLPDRYFEITQAQRNDMVGDENSHKIVDVKHDYLYVGGDGAQPSLTVALFRYHGVVTVAVLDGGYDPNIPTLDFLRYQNGRWLNVTRHVLPLPFDNQLAYFLPRRGTTIHVCNSQGHTVYTLLWKHGRFHLGLPQ